MVVPYKTISYRLSARVDVTLYSGIWKKRWPECVVGMVIHSKSPDERTTSVNVDWKIVQECRRRGHKIRGLKEYKKEHQRKRPAGRGVVSREAHGADAGSSEKPHGEVPRGWAQGRI